MTALTDEVNFKSQYEEEGFLSGGEGVCTPCTLPLDLPLNMDWI